MIPRLGALALAFAMAALLPGPIRAQGAGVPECQPYDVRARGQTARNEQMVQRYVAAMRGVRAAKEAGDVAGAVQYLRQGRQIAGEFGPLIQAMRANAIEAHRRGCIDDGLLAKALEGSAAADQAYRSLAAAAAQHERELRPYLAGR